MSFVDQPSGWRLSAIAATALAHAALIAGAATAFHVAQSGQGRPDALAVAVFETPAPPEPVKSERAPRPASREMSVPERAEAPMRETKQLEEVPSLLPMAGAMSGATLESAALARPVVLPAPSRQAEQSSKPTKALEAYTGALRAAIMQRRPRTEKAVGTVTVGFTLNRSGQLLDSTIQRSSGQVRLDRLALRMVRQAAPFVAPPEDVPDGALVFQIPIRFH